MNDIDCLKDRIKDAFEAHEKVHLAESKVMEARLAATRWLIGTAIACIPVIGAILYFLRGGR